jgi:GNAT acetyltransferase-like protein
VLVRPITAADLVAYEAVIGESETTLLYAGATYRRFLERLLPDSRPCYLGAWDGSTLVGALPGFIHDGRYGPVLNSLPFYGSHGGVIVPAPDVDAAAVKRALLGALDEFAREERAVAATIVTNPLDPDRASYESHWVYTAQDDRIGQLTPLPALGGDSTAVQRALMERFHPKTRNSIRKGQKTGFHIDHEGSLHALERLAALHHANITALGGMAKPWRVFLTIREVFTYDRDYRVYTAERDGVIAAALLVFFYHRTAEYFTPAVAEAHRSLQPVSLLALEAMEEAVRRGCRYWNWGGTWRSQEGVYRFKSRFGAEERPYYYLVREYSPVLRQVPARDLLTAYPYFYVVPFGALTAAASDTPSAGSP